MRLHLTSAYGRGRALATLERLRDNVEAVTADQIKNSMHDYLDPETMIMLVVGNIEEIMKGHPDHDAKLTDFGEIKKIPLRDPMTLEPIVE